MLRNLAALQLCSLSSSSFCLIPFQVRPPLLSSSQTISALLKFCNSFQQLSNLSHFPPQLNSFHLFPALLHLFLSSCLKSSHLNSGQLFSTLLTSCHSVTEILTQLTHRESFYTEKRLHTAALTHRKLLHRETFTHSKF